jgi:hypothetical protein
MGSDAELYLFDNERYVGEIVPLFHEFIRTGNAPDWLAHFIVENDMSFTFYRFIPHPTRTPS